MSQSPSSAGDNGPAAQVMTQQTSGQQPTQQSTAPAAASTRSCAGPSAHHHPTGPPQRQSSIPVPSALLNSVNANKQRQPMCTECEKSLPNQIVFDKIESIIRKMQDEQNGLPVKTAKSFMTKIPSVFTGTDLVQWMMRNLRLDDQQEAIHLANLIASHGYIFPIEDHTLSIKNDCTFYRFQTPYLWPSNNIDPENTDYAVYLCKRTMQGKTRLELADYEAENLARLQKMFSRKWEFIFMQAESQAKVDKKRDKLERKVLDSQERAFWDVYRPVPGCVNTTELDIKKACRLSKSAKRCSECQKVASVQTGAGQHHHHHQSILAQVSQLQQPQAPSPSPEVAQMKGDHQVHRLSFKQATSPVSQKPLPQQTLLPVADDNAKATVTQLDEQVLFVETPDESHSKASESSRSDRRSEEQTDSQQRELGPSKARQVLAHLDLQAQQQPKQSRPTTRPATKPAEAEQPARPADGSEQQELVSSNEQQSGQKASNNDQSSSDAQQQQHKQSQSKQQQPPSASSAAHSHQHHQHSHAHHPHHHHHHHHHHHPHSHSHAHHHHHHHRQCPHHHRQQQAKAAAQAAQQEGTTTTTTPAADQQADQKQQQQQQHSITTKCQNRCSLRLKQRSSGSVDQLMGPPASGSSRRKSECNRMLSMSEVPNEEGDKATAQKGQAGTKSKTCCRHSKEQGQQEKQTTISAKSTEHSDRPSSACCSLASMNTESASGNQARSQLEPLSSSSGSRNDDRQQTASTSGQTAPTLRSHLQRKSSLNIVRPPTGDQTGTSLRPTSGSSNADDTNAHPTATSRKGSVSSAQHQRPQLKGAQSICAPHTTLAGGSQEQLHPSAGLVRVGSAIGRRELGCGTLAASTSAAGTAEGAAPSSGNLNELERELESLRIRLDRGGVKMSKVTQSYLSYFNQWAEYDPFIAQPLPSNPWQSDSTELWDSERQTKDVHCRRVRRWAFSLKELLNDPAGREQFHRFLEKEFSAENLKFWDAVQELKRVHAKDVARRVEAIWTEYLAQDANCPINIDSKSYETSKKNMAKNKNNRYIFDEAAGHVYQLMKNDSYPRYLRSDMYKDYKEASERRRPNQVAFDVFKPQITTLKHKFNF